MAKECSQSGSSAGHKAFLQALKEFVSGLGTYNNDLAEGSPPNSGAGSVSGIAATVDSETEVLTLTCTDTAGTTFSVSGSRSGALASATVDTPYSVAQIGFTIDGGSPAFAIGDSFTFSTTAGAMALGQLDAAVAATANTGAGTVAIDSATVLTVDEVLTLTCTDTAGTTFSVVGSVSGSMGSATVGTGFTHAKCEFTISAGSPAISIGDVFTINAFAPRPWTVNRWDTTSGLNSPQDDYELLLQGQGLDGSEEIYVGAVTFEGSEAAGDYYNWQLFGFTGYDAGQTIYNQPDDSSFGGVEGSSGLALDNTAITYWMKANGQRIVIEAKVQNTYQPAYLGLFDRAGTAGQFPYPLAIGGSNDNSGKIGYRFSQATNRSPYDPCYNTQVGGGVEGSTLVVRDLIGWKYGRNWTGTSQLSAGVDSYINTAPYFQANIDTKSVSLMNKGVGGNHKLTRIGIFNFEAAFLGWFDGVYHVTGDDNVTESSGTIDGVTHRCFSTIGRVDNDDFRCVDFPNNEAV